MDSMRQIKAITIVLIMLFIHGCAEDGHPEAGRVVEIIVALKVNGDGYVFSDGDSLEIGKDKFSMREKAIYGEDGVLDKLIVYKPEGALEYSKEEILRDRKLIDYSQIPYKQDWVYKDLHLLGGGDKSMEPLEKIDGYLLMREEGGRAVLFKIEEANQ